MSETTSPEPLEAVLISGPNRGRIIEVPASAGEQPSQEELRLLNLALDHLLGSLERFEDAVRKARLSFENRERGY